MHLGVDLPCSFSKPGIYWSIKISLDFSVGQRVLRGERRFCEQIDQLIAS